MSIQFGECHLKEGPTVSEGVIAWERGDLLVPATAFLAIPDLSTTMASGYLFPCPGFRKSTAVRCEASDIRKDGRLLDALRCRAEGGEKFNSNSQFPLGLPPAGPSMDVETYEDGDTVLAGTNFYGLFALEKNTGRLLWRFRYHTVYSPPTIVPLGRYAIIGPVLGGLPLTQEQTVQIENRWNEDAASRSALIAAVHGGEDVAPDLRALVEALDSEESDEAGDPSLGTRACRDCSDRYREKAVLIPNPSGVLPYDIEDPVFAACGGRFIARAHSLKDALAACTVAERRYAQLLPELGFAPRRRLGLHLVTLYAHHDEFLKETLGLPTWSAGVTELHGIYVTGQYDLDWGLTHEIVHLLLKENLGRAQDSHAFRWFEEGLAGAMEPVPAYASAPMRTLKVMEELRRDPIPFQVMIASSTTQMDSESHGRWQTQASSVVRFIRNQCGKDAIRSLLKAVGAGQLLERALAGVCHGRWTSLRDLEDDWRVSIQTGGKTADPETSIRTNAGHPSTRPSSDRAGQRARTVGTGYEGARYGCSKTAL